MKKKFLVPGGISVVCALLFFGCRSGDYSEHLYWKQDPRTGFYVRHCTLTELSPEEIQELGLVETLPEGAQTVR